MSEPASSPGAPHARAPGAPHAREPAPPPGASPARVAIEVASVSRLFDETVALNDVTLNVGVGEIHAFLGPNGAGKTTLLRILAGLLEPTSGEVRVLGRSFRQLTTKSARKLFGLVPSGDRTFYLRLSGLENLVFFGRVHGLPKGVARTRAWECLEAVDLMDAARRQVGLYSHGMQKRLSVARALLMRPPILLVDEATHDLDLEGARRIQGLVTAAAGHEAAVMWTTQRLDEIRGFADRVTLLHRGEVRFSGSVPELMAMSVTNRYLLHLSGRGGEASLLSRARAALKGIATIAPSANTGGDHYLLALGDETTLGDALVPLARAGVAILGCREERSEIEQAFLQLTDGGRR